MTEQPQIRFVDGAAYETFMGVWSRSVGEIFLEWLAPGKGQAWIDVGCGNGAFTELLVERAAPSKVLAIDPSEEQLSFARGRHKAGVATFVKGDAMALPAEPASFNGAVMALVIFFVPQPSKGIEEMLRVTKPGGSVSAYAWDILDGGFPLAPIYEELKGLGIDAPLPPSAGASRMDALNRLWREAGLAGVETKVITVERTFPDFETLWAINMLGSRVAAVSSLLTPDIREALKAKVQARLRPDAGGRITTFARAHAIKGRVPS